MRWGKNVTAWLTARRKRNRAVRIAAVRQAPEFAEMTDVDIEEWIYGDVLK